MEKKHRETKEYMVGRVQRKENRCPLELQLQDALSVVTFFKEHPQTPIIRDPAPCEAKISAYS